VILATRGGPRTADRAVVAGDAPASAVGSRRQQTAPIAHPLGSRGGFRADQNRSSSLFPGRPPRASARRSRACCRASSARLVRRSGPSQRPISTAVTSKTVFLIERLHQRDLGFHPFAAVNAHVDGLILDGTHLDGHRSREHSAVGPPEFDLAFDKRHSRLPHAEVRLRPVSASLGRVRYRPIDTVMLAKIGAPSAVA
jgi:hypothetical protein